MYDVFDVANWYLANLDNITNKKLQKLVYYAYSWHLVLNNPSIERLDCRFFENKFEAWIHGAVYPELYYRYSTNGSNIISKYTGELKKFSEDEVDVLKQVASVYGKYNGNELESICHQEAPWRKARNGLPPYEPSNNLIKDEDIFECYSRRL